MALQLWGTLKESISDYTGLSPAAFFTVVALGLTLYYVISKLFGSSGDAHIQQRSRGSEEQMEPLPPPVQVGEITAEELKQYDGSDPKKPLLMAIKGQIYDVTQSKMFYGPGGPYALFAGKDASRALAKMSFEDKDLNGDLTGLGVFELEALQDWEYKFMSKYVKVGTVKTTVPVTEGSAEGQATETSKNDAIKTIMPVTEGSAEGQATETSERDAIKTIVPVTEGSADGQATETSERDAIKTIVPVTEGSAEGQATETSENDAAKPAEAAEGDAAKPVEDGPSKSVPKETEETTTAAVDPEKKE